MSSCVGVWQGASNLSLHLRQACHLGRHCGHSRTLAVPWRAPQQIWCMLPATFFTKAKTYRAMAIHFRKARQPVASAAAAGPRPRVHRTRPTWFRKLPSPRAARLDGNRLTRETGVQGGSILQVATHQPRACQSPSQHAIPVRCRLTLAYLELV